MVKSVPSLMSTCQGLLALASRVFNSDSFFVQALPSSFRLTLESGDEQEVPEQWATSVGPFVSKHWDTFSNR